MKKFTVFVRIFRKGSMLNPEEGVILRALRDQEFTNFSAIRVGKCIEIELGAQSEGDVRSSIENFFRRSDTVNPVAETFEIVSVTEKA